MRAEPRPAMTRIVEEPAVESEALSCITLGRGTAGVYPLLRPLHLIASRRFVGSHRGRLHGLRGGAHVPCGEKACYPDARQRSAAILNIATVPGVPAAIVAPMQPAAIAVHELTYSYGER